MNFGCAKGTWCACEDMRSCGQAYPVTPTERRILNVLYAHEVNPGDNVIMANIPRLAAALANAVSDTEPTDELSGLAHAWIATANSLSRFSERGSVLRRCAAQLRQTLSTFSGGRP